MTIDARWWIRYLRRELALTCQALALVLCTPLAVRAQQDTIPQRGFFAAGSYALSDLETINTANGNVMFRIPLVSLPPGRGGTPGPTVNLYYNSKLWDTFVWVSGGCPPGWLDRNELVKSPDGGWRYAFYYELELDDRRDHFTPPPGASCTDPGGDNIWKLKMRFPDGSVHELRPRGFSDFFADGYFKVSPDGFQVCSGTVTSPMTYYSTDGSFLKLVIQHDTDTVWTNNPWTLYFNDGRRVTGGNAPQRIYDRNNNFVEFRNITYNAHPATQIIDQLDQLGRSVIVEYGSAPEQDSVYRWGVNNERLQWIVHWTTVSLNKLYFADDTMTCTSPLTTPLRVVSQISLPAQAGALSYTFDYNPTAASPGWGELSVLTLPSGAQTTYQYRYDGADSILWSNVIDNVPTRKDLTYLREYDGASAQTTDTWLYSGGWGGSGLTITAPDGGVLSNYTDWTSGWTHGLIYKTDNPDGRVVESLWNRNLPFGVASAPNLAANPYVKTEFTSLKDSLGNPVKTAIKDFIYDQNGNLKRLAEYDWVAYSAVPRDTSGRPTGIPPGASLKRILVNTYYNPAPNAISTIADMVDDPNAYYHSSSPALRNARESSEVRDGADQALSRTEYVYDNAATTGN